MLQRIQKDPALLPRGKFVQEEMAAIRKLIANLADLAGEELADKEDQTERDAARGKLLERLAEFAELVIPSQEHREMILVHLQKTMEDSNAATFPELLGVLTGPEDTFDQELEPGKINILTMHRAKGLSADAVIIVAAEEQLIPGDATGEAFDDQRRLLYVSLTRARHHLYVTYCNNRVGRQRYSGNDPGNPRRTLTPFLRNAMPVEDGVQYIRRLNIIRRR